MSSRDSIRHRGGVQGGLIVKSGRHVMAGHEAGSNKGFVLRGALAMKVDLSKFGSIPGKKYG